MSGGVTRREFLAEARICSSLPPGLLVRELLPRLTAWIFVAAAAFSSSWIRAFFPRWIAWILAVAFSSSMVGSFETEVDLIAAAAGADPILGVIFLMMFIVLLWPLW